MKIRFLTTVLFLLALVSASSAAEENLLYTSPAWYPATDHFASSSDTGNSFFSEGTISVDFTLAVKKPDGDWPYVELVCETGAPITGTDSIKVSYKCDTTLVMKLYQTDLGSEGLQTYALYQIELPSSKEWHTEILAIKDFVQPTWADEKSRAVALNLNNVERIYFTPKISAETGGKSTISIKHLSLIKK